VPSSRSHDRDRDRDWSIAPTLAVFVVAIVPALAITGHWNSVRELIDRAPGVEAEAQAAGPTFVQQEQHQADVISDDEVDDLAETDNAATDTATGGGAASTDDTVKPVKTPIEDSCIDGTDDACKRWAMDGFYDALAHADTSLARTTLWGDSVTAEGYIADGIRARFDRTYDDGGAGFVFLAQPSRWYQNTAARQSQSGSWLINSIVSNETRDHLYGYGGVSFSGTSGDVATVRTAKSGPGSKVSHVEVYYLQSPKGGTADVLIDGEVQATIDSQADTTSSAFTALDVDDGAHEIQVKVTKGKLRGYGVTMDRATGVAVDSLGVVSNTAKAMSSIDATEWREQLGHRKSALMMILLGTNESQWLSGAKAMKEYQTYWAKLLDQMRKGNPDGTCLVIGTLDAGDLDGDKFVGRASIDAMLGVERKAAKAAGCAFWDSRAYMGGKASSRKWYKKGLMSGDFAHLTKKGGHVLGAGIVEALEAGYALRSKR
jgi:hypothetical protein